MQTFHPWWSVRVWALWAILGSLTSLTATTVHPPRFADLVSQADRVIHGRITGKMALADEHQGHELIRTEVTVEVIEIVAGKKADGPIVLDFLGGTLNGMALRIAGMPDLATGDEVVLFEVGNGSHVCPLVSWRYGHYPITRAEGGGAPKVKRSDSRPLVSIEQIGTPLHEDHADDRIAAGQSGMTLAAFKAAIRGETEAGGRDE